MIYIRQDPLCISRTLVNVAESSRGGHMSSPCIACIAHACIWIA